MGDPYKKVRSGDRLIIPARTYNGFIDAARDFQERQRNVTSRSIQSNSRPGIIPVKNTTGTDLDQFAIVGLDAPLYGPDDNEDEFRHHVTIVAITPTVADHWLKYGITQEPIPDGKIGLCMIAGFTVCKVKVNKDWHRYATVVDGETGHMESAPTGDAIIQWTQGMEGGGADWALVAIKAGDPCIRWGKAVSNWHRAAGNGCYVEVNPCENQNGDNVDTMKTIKVWLPRHGRDEDPNIIADSVIPFIMSDPAVDPQEGVCVGQYLDGKIDVSYRLINKNAELPPGWIQVDAANARTLALNTDPPVAGFDRHGAGENNHAIHVDHDTHADHHLSESLSHNTHPQPSVEVQQTSITEGDKYTASVGREGPAAITGWDGSHTNHELHVSFSHDAHTPHDIHTETSNWPPWYTVKLIIRYDNSAA